MLYRSEDEIGAASSPSAETGSARRAPFDPVADRRRFTLLDERRYFASQCLGPVPIEAFEDLATYASTLRLGKRAIELWLERMEETTLLVEALLGAPRHSVALMPNATAAQAAVAACVQPTAERRRVVLSTLDFHSSRYLWRAQAQRGFEVHEVGALDDGSVDMDAVLRAIDHRTAVVALALVSPRSGALLDVARVTARARDAGALVVIDAYQAVGIVPLSVETLGADVVCGGTHKWLWGGSLGLAFLYVRPEIAEQWRPGYPGWLGQPMQAAFGDDFIPAPGARRLQQGTPAIEPMYAARAGLRFALNAPVAALRARSITLTERIAAGAESHGLRLASPRNPASRGGMVCLTLSDSEALVHALAVRGMDVDSRPGAGLRIGPHPCCTEAECDELVAAIAEIVATP